jgi:hypothetical protein
VTETFRIVNPKSVQAAEFTVTANQITQTEDNTIVLGNGVRPIAIFKVAMDYTIAKV